MDYHPDLPRAFFLLPTLSALALYAPCPGQPPEIK